MKSRFLYYDNIIIKKAEIIISDKIVNNRIEYIDNPPEYIEQYTKREHIDGDVVIKTTYNSVNIDKYIKTYKYNTRDVISNCLSIIKITERVMKINKIKKRIEDEMLSM